MSVLFQILLQRNDTQGTKNQVTSIFTGLRYLMALFFPNVTVKRAIYDLKIRDNSYCINRINSYLECKYSYNLKLFIFSNISIKPSLVISKDGRHIRYK